MIAKWYKLYWVHCSELLSHYQKSRITHAVFTKKQVQVGMVGICVPAALTWNDSARIIGRSATHWQWRPRSIYSKGATDGQHRGNRLEIFDTCPIRARMKNGMPRCTGNMRMACLFQWKCSMRVSNGSIQWKYPMAVSNGQCQAQVRGQSESAGCYSSRSVPSTGYSPLPSLCGIQ